MNNENETKGYGGVNFVKEDDNEDFDQVFQVPLFIFSINFKPLWSDGINKTNLLMSWQVWLSSTVWYSFF